MPFFVNKFFYFIFVCAELDVQHDCNLLVTLNASCLSRPAVVKYNFFFFFFQSICQPTFHLKILFSLDLVKTHTVKKRRPIKQIIHKERLIPPGFQGLVAPMFVATKLARLFLTGING